MQRQKAAGKTAIRKGCAGCVASDVRKSNVCARRPMWKHCRVGGSAALRSPDGRCYYGTSAEVREAALTPWRRDALAESLRIVLRSAVGSREDRAEDVREARREAIMASATDRVTGCQPSVRLKDADRIFLGAGARLLGFDSFDEYIRRLVESEKESLAEFALNNIGKAGMPFTRHERAALARLGVAQ